MRIDLDTPLKAGEQVSFTINWWYNVNNMMEIGGRSGYEYFPKDDNRLYVIAQFYPRMCVYNDVEGWQNKQFLGRGEFAVPFGNYKVSLNCTRRPCCCFDRNPFKCNRCFNKRTATKARTCPKI